MQISVLTFGVHWSLIIQCFYIPMARIIGSIAVVISLITKNKIQRQALKKVITDKIKRFNMFMKKCLKYL